MCIEQLKNQIKKEIGLNIDKIIDDLKLNGGKNNGKLYNDELIFCYLLLGYTEFTLTDGKKQQKVSISEQKIRDIISKSLYEKIAELMRVEKQDIAANWRKIFNFFLKPNNGYRLDIPPQLNDDSFQASFGNQLFLPTNNPDILEHQVRGTEHYENGLYFFSFESFIKAWNEEKKISQHGNPETLIYALNSYIESHKQTLEEQNIFIYTIVVIVPIHHNFGRVAKEILRGVAQLQLKINLETFNNISDQYGTNLTQQLEKKLEIKKPFSSLIDKKKIALKILIVNENNTIYGENKTANHLVEIAKNLNIMAVIGHYSSEMTEKAVKVYAKKGLILITPSSTSNNLSQLLKNELNFYRMTTSDEFVTKALISYLSQNFSELKISQKIGIIYNSNSTYSSSFKKSICQEINSTANLNLVNECDRLSRNYEDVKEYLKENTHDILIIIPDGGVEPLSLQNVGLITRSRENLMIAGGATLYHDSLLDWLEYSKIAHNDNKIIICIPWHYDSISQNNSTNSFFKDFGRELWGEKANQLLTWRSATAFDSVYMVLRALDRQPAKNCQELSEYMARDFRENSRREKGITGEIAFDNSGDRLNPSTVIVATNWNQIRKKWEFIPVTE